MEHFGFIFNNYVLELMDFSHGVFLSLCVFAQQE